MVRRKKHIYENKAYYDAKVTHFNKSYFYHKFVEYLGISTYILQHISYLYLFKTIYTLIIRILKSLTSTKHFLIVYHIIIIVSV